MIGKRSFKLDDDHPVFFLDFIQKFATEVGGELGTALFDEETGTVGPAVAIMLNGVHYNHLPNRLNTVLKDQDEVAVFPPGAGG